MSNSDELEWQAEVRRRAAEKECYTCGEPNPDTCSCAKARWFARSSGPNEWNAKWREYIKGKGGLGAICPTCGGSSMSFCECAKQRWIASQQQKETPQ